jgi:hypothetical protein
VCKRWAALLREDRFWRRHHEALRERAPLLEAALKKTVVLAPPTMTLSVWYERVAQWVLGCFEPSDGKSPPPLKTSLWEAMLWSALGGEQCVRFTVHALRYDGITTQIELVPTGHTGFVALRWYEFTQQEVSLRKGGLHDWKKKKRAENKDTKPRIFVSVAGKPLQEVAPKLVAYRLLSVLFNPEALSVRSSLLAAVVVE